MELTAFFKSLIDQNINPIVLWDTNHIIGYMNPAAIDQYAYYGGEALVGKSVMGCHRPVSREEIEKTAYPQVRRFQFSISDRNDRRSGCRSRDHRKCDRPRDDGRGGHSGHWD